MLPRRDLCLAAALGALSFSTFGCSRDLPTSSPQAGRHTASSSRGAHAAIETQLARGAVTFFNPTAISSIRHFPELGILDEGYRSGGIPGVDGDMYSSFFRTTGLNREFRRGFAEFVVPSFSDVFSAKIVLRETRAGIAAPLPPDHHELSYYTDVDLLVNTSDFDRPTSPLGTFETDANLSQGTFDFDVSDLVTRLRGGRLGFRVKLEADPDYTALGFLGSGFARYSTPCGFRIEVITTRAEASRRLQDIIREMGLPAGVEAGLLGPLHRVAELLSDDNPNNDRAACGKLGEFIDVVQALYGRGQLSSPQDWDLEELAGNLVASVGCAGRDMPSRPGITPAPAQRERS